MGRSKAAIQHRAKAERLGLTWEDASPLGTMTTTASVKQVRLWDERWAIAVSQVRLLHVATKRTVIGHVHSTAVAKHEAHR